MKFVNTNKIKIIDSEEKIKKYFKKFELLEEKKLEVNDTNTEPPHKHDILVLILKR